MLCHLPDRVWPLPCLADDGRWCQLPALDSQLLGRLPHLRRCQRCLQLLLFATQ